MENIGRRWLTRLGLTTDKAPRSPRTPTSAPPASAQQQDVHDAAGSTPAGIFRRLLKISPGAPAPAGLSVREAVKTLQKEGHLASRGANQRAKAALGDVPAQERAGVVAAARFLLPQQAPTQAIESVLQHLRGLSAADRVTLAQSAGRLAPSVRLQDASDVHAYLGLLRTVGALPTAAQVRVAAACREAQPSWHEEVPAEAWTPLVQTLARVPTAELRQFAADVRVLFASNPDGMHAFTSAVERHANLNANDRATLRQQIGDTRLDHADGQAGERLRAFAAEPPAERATIAQACREIFAATTGPRETPSERANLASGLVQTPVPDRAQLVAIARDARRAGVPITPWMLQEALGPVASPLRDQATRQSLFAAFAAAFPRGSSGSTGWLTIRTLAQLPAAEHADAARLAQALDARGTLTRQTADAEILRASPAQRRQHAARLGGNGEANRAAQGVGGAHDLENVMQGPLQRQVQSAIAALHKRFPDVGSTRRALNQLEVHLHTLQRRYATQPEHALMTRRGGDTEIGNALRTLSANSRPGDFSDSVRNTPDMAKLCALVWHATSAPRPGVDTAQAKSEQELMRYGLVMALAHCIEDDGHRVCGVGQRQHTVDALKGYYPEAGDALSSVTPASLVTVLAEDFYKEHGERSPSDAEVKAFTARALGVAAERFGETAPQHADFKDQLQSYLRLTYAPDA